MRKSLPVITFCLILLSVQSAFAGYYSNNYQFIIGERAAGMGGAYTAIANDSTALWYNPAGLARISDMHLNISGNTYSYLKTTTEGFYQLPKYGGSESINMEESDFSVVANTLIFGKKLGDNQAVSFGLFIPSQDTLMGSMKAKDFVDVNGNTINFKDDTSLISKYYVGMLGYGVQATDDLNIGASIGIGYYQAQYRDNYFTHVENSGEESISFANYAIDDTEYTIQGGFGMQYVQYEIDGIQQRVGLYIQAPTYRLSGNTTEKMVCYDSNSYCGPSGDKTFYWSPEDSAGLKNDPYAQILPGFISFGYGYEKPDSFGFSLDIVPVFPVPEDESYANSVVNIKAGLESYLTKSMIIRAGFFTDFSQKDDVKKDSDTPDGTDKINYYGGTLSLSFGKHLMETEIKEESAKIDIYGRPLETEAKKKGNKTVPTPIKRTLWSTFGIVARYGTGDVKVTKYDASYKDFPEIKDKSVLNFQAFIAESMSF